MIRRIGLIAGFAAIVALAAAPAARAQSQGIVTIGTGGVGGVYYPAGRAICRLFNEANKGRGVRCAALSTKGSIFNINALRGKSQEMAVVQSDWQYHGYHGTAKFKKKGPFQALRAVFSLHSEPFTVVARADAGIKRFADLPGKRVNVSNPGSGARGTMIEVMKVMGWRAKTFAEVRQLNTAKQAKALCDNAIDVMVYTVGHPSETIRLATDKCDARLINVTGAKIDTLIKSRPYFSQASIAPGIYKNNTRRVRTFGVSATFVTTAGLPAPLVHDVVEAVFSRLAKFRNLHPALKHLNKNDMVKNALTAPLHPGAVKYYKSVGLM